MFVKDVIHYCMEGNFGGGTLANLANNHEFVKFTPAKF